MKSTTAASPQPDMADNREHKIAFSYTHNTDSSVAAYSCSDTSDSPAARSTHLSEVYARSNYRQPILIHHSSSTSGYSQVTGVRIMCAVTWVRGGAIEHKPL